MFFELRKKLKSDKHNQMSRVLNFYCTLTISPVLNELLGLSALS